MYVFNNSSVQYVKEPTPVRKFFLSMFIQAFGMNSIGQFYSENLKIAVHY